MLKSPAVMTISEVARRACVRTSALRYYESVGILPPPERVSGQRRYAPGILRQIQFIQFAQRAGFSIAEIRMLLNAHQTGTPYSERLQQLARHKLQEVDTLIAQAQAMRKVLEVGLNCQCPTLEDCLLFFKAGGEENCSPPPGSSASP